MKVKGFIKDVGGSSRVTKMRRSTIQAASGQNMYVDPIREAAEQVHPSSTPVIVERVEDVSPTARRFTFAAEEGSVLPPFQAGQYCSLDLKIGDTITTRPYSISSAPYEARQKEHPHFDLTIRNGKEDGFAANYLYEHLKVGTALTAHLADGQFFYEPLRDTKQVVALAGGSGITPFYSMAKEIEHGGMDFDLTILYGSVSSKDIILGQQLEAIRSPRVHFVNVISGEPDYPGEKGFINADLIRRYTKGDPASGMTTYFVCGPLPMYQFVRGELEKLHVPEKRIRMEVFGAPRDITKEPDYPTEKAGETVKITVVRGIREDVIDALTTETLAVSLERAGIPNNTRCRSGACGYCRAKLLEGEVYVPTENDGRRSADRTHGYIHACQTYPLSDCKVRIVIK